MKVGKKRVSPWGLMGIGLLAGLISFDLFFNDMVGLYRTKNWVILPCLYVQNYAHDYKISWDDHFQSKRDLVAHNKVLVDEVAELQSELIATKAEKIFEEETAELRDYRSRYELQNDIQLARVLVRHIDGEEHFYYIDQGIEKGVSVDDPVVYKNCLIGKITEVHHGYSKVLLVTDSKCHVAVICTDTKTPGIYQGTCSLDHAVVQHISHMQSLKVGDLIISAGEGLVFPYGFGVGTIESFEQKGVQYVVTVKPLLDVSNIKFCYVIKRQNGDV